MKKLKPDRMKKKKTESSSKVLLLMKDGSSPNTSSGKPGRTGTLSVPVVLPGLWVFGLDR